MTIAAPPAGVAYRTFWSNDGTSSGGSQPTDAVSLPVTKGLYAVLLGDTTLPNMTAVPASVFANADVWLRVWFDDGLGFQLLAPDQRIAAVGYAMVAASVPDGAITATKLAVGAVGTMQLAPGAVASASLQDGAITSAKLGGGVVGAAQLAPNAVAGANVQDGALTSVKLASGEVVTSLNSLKDDVNLVAGPNITITPSGNTLQIAAAAGGLTASGTPQVGAVVAATDAAGSATWENGIRVVNVSRSTGAGQQATYGRNLIAGQNNAVAPGALGATVLGGGYERVNSYGFPQPGLSNYVSGDYATVIGGAGNTASDSYAMVSGGYSNVAGGAYSFAAGRQAKAANDGSFVWADSQNASFASTANNQFLIRADGGVGIGTASPQTALHVVGTVTATSFVGDGSGLSGLPGGSSLAASDGTPAHAVQVDAEGRVGIGTTTPAETLHVTGTVRIQVGGTTITVGSDGKVLISAAGKVDINSTTDINLTAGNDINISASHNLKLQGNNRIDLN